jgi:hypothetical protein
MCYHCCFMTHHIFFPHTIKWNAIVIHILSYSLNMHNQPCSFTTKLQISHSFTNISNELLSKHFFHWSIKYIYQLMKIIDSKT